ncbi:CreA protein [Sulfitobacter noctilucae]|nr:CreA protein [Sulfitobacter noctilucae]
MAILSYEPATIFRLWKGTICAAATFERMKLSRAHLIAPFLLSFAALPLSAEEVGNVDVDWLGNDIVVEAVSDPEVQGVTCHLAYFERGIIDRLQKGNWFEDPSNSSISCRQTGPIVIGDIERGDEGEDVFSERRSIIFKTLRVKRIFDEANNTLIYISHARDVQNGSAKMSMSTVPLYQP